MGFEQLRSHRQVQLDDEDNASERVSIGDLAHEARELLEEVARAGQGDAPKGNKKGR